MAYWSVKRNDAIQGQSIDQQSTPSHVRGARSMIGGSGAMADAEIVKFPTRAAIAYPAGSVLKLMENFGSLGTVGLQTIALRVVDSQQLDQRRSSHYDRGALRDGLIACLRCESFQLSIQLRQG